MSLIPNDVSLKNMRSFASPGVSVSSLTLAFMARASSSIGFIMAFASSAVVLGKKVDRVKRFPVSGVPAKNVKYCPARDSVRSKM